MTRQLIFFGISTSGSSILSVFPLWSDILGLDATIRGEDIPAGAPAAAYRRAVEELRADESISGALVTSHKVAFHEHAGDLFDELDELAVTCHEISCISKRDSKLCGAAKDPVVSANVLDALIPRGHWAHSRADALCLGAGGAGTAISVALLNGEDAPRRVLVTDTRATQLRRLRQVHRRLGAEDRVDYQMIRDTTDSDRLVEALAPGSLVVNATGMGKDTPGSPLSHSTEFPQDGVVWELNYRGDLDFLGQAQRQRDTRNLRIENGWEYFIQAWVALTAEVFSLTISHKTVAQLAEAAEPYRPRALTAQPN
jgi:shikimate 5-dehydrogenase